MKCWLKSTNPEYPSIELKNKESLFIGRSRQSKIKDTRVSRLQVEVTPDFEHHTVKIRQLGPNNSGLNGHVLGIGLTETGHDGDTIALICTEESKLYTYIIAFESESPTESRNILKRQSLQGLSGGNSMPTKIPKMFLPKASTSGADAFRKVDLLSKGKWEHIRHNDLFIYSTENPSSNSKSFVGGFDMDGTLIKTKSGRVFPKDEQDWTFLTASVVTKLQTFFTQNPDFKFVIFTNQAGLKKPDDIPPFKRKIEDILRKIAIPAVVLVGTKKDEYRKPMTGGWDIFVQKYNEGIDPDLEGSFYCGDAAGRPKDHSTSDRLFALNIGLKFKIPEEFFDGVKPPQYSTPLFSPKDFLNKLGSNGNNSNGHIQFPYCQEMILMVGYPAAGKSSFVKSVLVPKGYVHINRDTMKTMPKCIQLAETAMQEGKRVVIDNTNPARKDREVFLKLAKQHRVPARCFTVKVDHIQALHNNKFRHLIGDLQAPVPDVAFNSFKSSFQEPSLDEGYEEIMPVYFVPEFGNNEERVNLYGKYLLDK